MIDMDPACPKAGTSYFLPPHVQVGVDCPPSLGPISWSSGILASPVALGRRWSRQSRWMS